jgi:hypothetical protein
MNFFVKFCSIYIYIKSLISLHMVLQLRIRYRLIFFFNLPSKDHHQAKLKLYPSSKYFA